MNEQSFSGRLWVVAAPSGGGKTSIIRNAVESLENVVESISYTTRKPRSLEQNGVDYYFIDQDKFKSLISENDLLEYANVFEFYYGTSNKLVNDLLAKGNDVILNIDCQGALQIRKKRPDAKMVFLLPPSLKVLRERLFGRNQDSLEVIDKRMAQAINQIEYFAMFDFVIVNDDFDLACNQFKTLILADRLNKNRQLPQISPLIDRLKTEDGLAK